MVSIWIAAKEHYAKLASALVACGYGSIGHAEAFVAGESHACVSLILVLKDPHRQTSWGSASYR